MGVRSRYVGVIGYGPTGKLYGQWPFEWNNGPVTGPAAGYPFSFTLDQAEEQWKRIKKLETSFRVDFGGGQDETLIFDLVRRFNPSTSPLLEEELELMKPGNGATDTFASPAECACEWFGALEFSTTPLISADMRLRMFVKGVPLSSTLGAADISERMFWDDDSSEHGIIYPSWVLTANFTNHDGSEFGATFRSYDVDGDATGEFVGQDYCGQTFTIYADSTSSSALSVEISITQAEFFDYNGVWDATTGAQILPTYQNPM